MVLAKGMGMGMGMGRGATAGGLATHAVYGESLTGRHEWRSTVLLVEFMMTSGWQSEIDLPDPPLDDSPKTLEELETLRRYQDEIEGREQRYDEIMAETHDYVGLFENLCYFDATSRPVTSLLVQATGLIGWTLVQYYKERYARPRPSYLDPLLRPIIRVPTFSAYPSGHATQAYLTRLALGAVYYDREPAFHEELERVATRIGRNREFAGVHYETDSTAGYKLAGDIWALIERNANFTRVIEEAIAEDGRKIQTGHQFLADSGPPLKEEFEPQV